MNINIDRRLVIKVFTTVIVVTALLTLLMATKEIAGAHPGTQDVHRVHAQSDIDDQHDVHRGSLWKWKDDFCIFQRDHHKLPPDSDCWGTQKVTATSVERACVPFPDCAQQAGQAVLIDNGKIGSLDDCTPVLHYICTAVIHNDGFAFGLFYSVHQEARVFWDGDDVWARYVYRGYKGYYSCWAGYEVGMSVDTQECDVRWDYKQTGPGRILHSNTFIYRYKVSAVADWFPFAASHWMVARVWPWGQDIETWKG